MAPRMPPAPESSSRRQRHHQQQQQQQQQQRRPPAHRESSTHSKASLPSSSRSNEADDEQSISDLSSVMAPSSERRGRRGYAGEDMRLTSSKELSGFYVYGWAAEVFVVCGMGSFIPITLEQLARERGVLLSDKSTPCATSFTTPARNGTASALSPPSQPSENSQCVVYILGLEVNTASFAMYTFSVSVLVQSLLIISMSGAADHGRYRKSLLLSFAFAGAVATMLFLPITSQVYILGALLAIVANTCFGASFVLLNSFLPLLVRHHPTIQYPSPQDSEDHSVQTEDNSTEEEDAFYGAEVAIDELADSTSALLPGGAPGHDAPTPDLLSRATSQELALSTKISSYGIGIGYIAAVLLQTVSVFVLSSTGSSTFSLRLVLFIIGAWWFVFSIPAALWLRPRPGPALDFERAGASRTWLAYFLFSWRSLGRTITHARGLKDVLVFLAAWFLLSDSIATVSGTAVLFAKTSLEMKLEALGLINVISMVSGVVGAFTWSRLSKMMDLRPSQTILACICLFELIPLYGLLGYIPAVRRLGVLGLQQAWEMYPLGAVYGFVLGGLSSYCRSLFGELIPPGFEAAFYALYAITDKGSSIFGPAIVGAITDATGEIRPAFWFLAVLVGLPLPLMLLVDVERGKRDGITMAQALEAAKQRPDRDEHARPAGERTRLAGG